MLSAAFRAHEMWSGLFVCYCMFCQCLWGVFVEVKTRHRPLFMSCRYTVCICVLFGWKGVKLVSSSPHTSLTIQYTSYLVFISIGSSIHYAAFFSSLTSNLNDHIVYWRRLLLISFLFERLLRENGLTNLDETFQLDCMRSEVGFYVLFYPTA